MGGGSESGLGRALVADVPIVDRIVRRDVMHLRRARPGGRRGVESRRQHAVVDDDLFRRVLGLRVSVGDDDGDMIADIAHLALGEDGMGARLHRRTVLGMDHPAADQAADLVGGDILAGEDRHDAGRLARRRDVDPVEGGVGVRRAQEIGMRLARTVDVVDVMAFAGDETDVFAALYRGANAGRAHECLPGCRRSRPIGSIGRSMIIQPHCSGRTSRGLPMIGFIPPLWRFRRPPSRARPGRRI